LSSNSLSDSARWVARITSEERNLLFDADKENRVIETDVKTPLNTFSVLTKETQAETGANTYMTFSLPSITASSLKKNSFYNTIFLIRIKK